jgi:hypothetical protein
MLKAIKTPCHLHLHSCEKWASEQGDQVSLWKNRPKFIKTHFGQIEHITFNKEKYPNRKSWTLQSFSKSATQKTVTQNSANLVALFQRGKYVEPGSKLN